MLKRLLESVVLVVKAGCARIVDAYSLYSLKGVHPLKGVHDNWRLLSSRCQVE
jgi:hypothetical protein